MVIKKFVSIDNVGRLAKSSQKGPELNTFNLFFAENGRGKTTLCSVLRSLETGQHEHITERKTLAPTAGEPAAVIRLDGGDARFSKAAWNQTVSDIAIFDATFVAQNVHAGEYVSRDHRSNLLQVIIGEAGVKLAQTVSSLDSSIREKNGEITRSKRGVEGLVPKGFKLEDFLALVKDDEIDAKIRAKDEELKTAKEADAIAKRAALMELAAPSLPEGLHDILSKTLDDVSADAERRLRQQIDQHAMHDKGETWLSEGLGYLKDDNCPFCGQNVAGLDLVEAYKQYFSDSYADLISEIETNIKSHDESFGDASIASIGRTITNNNAGLDFWRKHVAIEMPELDHDNNVSTPARGYLNAAKTLLAAKRSKPIEGVAPDEPYTAAVEGWRQVTVAVVAYNEAIKTANATISAKKEQAANADVAALERELAQLQCVKHRFEDKVKGLCDDYTTLVAEKDKLDKDKDAAKLALDTHADKMISDYETTINKLLKGFGAGFTITNSKKTYVGGTPTSAYQILINDHAVDLGDEKTGVGTPSFRTTLSAGDKSTLALAFFLAKLDHDPKKADRIIVFDDPFNSQDRSRRERTAELLKKYGGECKQLLLLSHDPFFLQLVHSKLPKKETHCLQLSRVPDNNTTIQEWDVEKETQDGYFKEHAALNSYMLNGAKDLIDIVRKIRPVLEGYLRYRFPNTFPDNEWLGGMIGKIRTEGAVHPMFAALEELEGINDFSKKYHHDTNPGKADSEPINDGELNTFVQRTLTIAGGY